MSVDEQPHTEELRCLAVSRLSPETPSVRYNVNMAQTPVTRARAEEVIRAHMCISQQPVVSSVELQGTVGMWASHLEKKARQCPESTLW